MKVIVDNKIPYIKEAVGQIADEVVYLPGAAFTPRDVKDADALIIRTRTCCNRELLEGSSVKFIATATIGFDHIDVDYAVRRVSHGAIVPDAMPVEWSNMCTLHFCCSSACAE